MIYKKTIYKKDSTGKIRFLEVSTNGATVIQKTGIVGSDNAVIHNSDCTPKNVGRSNATTAEEQAILEAKAKIETKMSTGYFETIEEAKNKIVILPMLAKDYNKEKKKVKFPCYVQPKLDGMRAIGGPGLELTSRQGKVIDTMDHIQQSLDNHVFGGILDGELYAHGKNFQENMRLIKKDRGKESEEVIYHVYDMVLVNKPFIERYKMLQEKIQNIPNIEIVPTYTINNEKELKEYHKMFLAQGYEGTIIRHSNAGYAINKRDSQLLKYKDFLDITAKIVAVKPMEKNPNQGYFICEIKEDHKTYTFGCGMKFSHKEREEILNTADTYLGKTAEIRFFEYSEDGIPRFPVCYGIREDL